MGASACLANVHRIIRMPTTLPHHAPASPPHFQPRIPEGHANFMSEGPSPHTLAIQANQVACCHTEK